MKLIESKTFTTVACSTADALIVIALYFAAYTLNLGPVYVWSLIGLVAALAVTQVAYGVMRRRVRRDALATGLLISGALLLIVALNLAILYNGVLLFIQDLT